MRGRLIRGGYSRSSSNNNDDDNDNDNDNNNSDTDSKNKSSTAAIREFPAAPKVEHAIPVIEEQEDILGRFATCGNDGAWKFDASQRCSLVGCGALETFLQPDYAIVPRAVGRLGPFIGAHLTVGTAHRFRAFTVKAPRCTSHAAPATAANRSPFATKEAGSGEKA
ncbi:hypothetical protein AK812_SmicGene13566 [Symbiodinium microadriaticum]|uniref:Uncharacterized protein n=1 Tax=Symbiodinium microadriaticum TaxID=2951 RepID=A0A1Q9E7V4_SYMMI|nr:hypothetical protein AK812_SmicGene13566 [Symbiodinium microadriaticum]